MKITDLRNNLTNTAVTVGTFDGVHRGHAKIIQTLKSVAQRNALTDVVITFRLPPRLILNPNANIKVLTLIDEKIELLKNHNVKYVHILPFDRALAQKSAEEFVSEYLVKKLGIKHLIMGYDHRFGKNKEAGFEEVKALGQKYGFNVTQVPPVKINNQNVSSSLIRQLISQGKIRESSELLGYNYFFYGKVVHGQNLGKKINFPTANLKVDPLKQMPGIGVYLVKVRFPGFNGYGVFNYGKKPTVQSANTALTAEVHILDFRGEIYGKTLRIELLERLRDEKKFSNLEQLKTQITRDIQKAKQILLHFE
jgi:riboflavin kinase/FMN adenylyltransferase